MISFYNLSLFTKIFCRYFRILIEKTTFEEFVEICEQIHRELEIQYNDENEIIDSSIDLLTNFFLEICSKPFN